MPNTYATLPSSDDESEELARIHAKLTRKRVASDLDANDDASLRSSDESSLSSNEVNEYQQHIQSQPMSVSSDSKPNSPIICMNNHNGARPSSSLRTRNAVAINGDKLLLQVLQDTMDAMKRPRLTDDAVPRSSVTTGQSTKTDSNVSHHHNMMTSAQCPTEQDAQRGDYNDGCSLTDEELLGLELDIFAPPEASSLQSERVAAPSGSSVNAGLDEQVKQAGDDASRVAFANPGNLNMADEMYQLWPAGAHPTLDEAGYAAAADADFTDDDMARAFGFEAAQDSLPSEQNPPFGLGGPEPTGLEADCRPCEVDPSLYAPDNYELPPPSFVHRYTKENRPMAQRKRTPVSTVFAHPVNTLWQGKFANFNNLQSEMANVLAFSDDNIVLSAPTGAGKTAIFEMAMARFFAVDLQVNRQPHQPIIQQQISNQRKIVYISPTKAICEERLNDWSTRLLAMNLGISVALVTGDGDPSDAFRDLVSAHVVLTTPEKWDSLTRRWTENFVLFSSFKLILVDEVHLLADESRGWTLESILCRMKTIQRAAAKSHLDDMFVASSSYQQTSPEAINSVMRCVAVSATLPNIDEIAEFLNASEAYMFDESYRPVPLTLHVIGQGFVGVDSASQYRFWSSLNKNVPEIIFKYSENRPAIVFCHSKADAENLADLLATVSGIAIRGSDNQDIASQTRITKLQRVLYAGIAYHHAGLELDDRALIQKAFTGGKIRVLCATSTLAMGVNTPAHLVVVKGTKAWRGGEQGYQDLDQASLLQMIGRAGRPGFDTTGTAVIMTDNKSKDKYQRAALDGLSVAKSNFLMKKEEIVNTAISQGEISSAADATNWLKQTLYFVQLIKNGAPQSSPDAHILHICHEIFSNLVKVGAIEQGEGDMVKPAAAGFIMSQSLVDFEALRIMTQIPHDANQCDVLKAIAHIAGLHRPVKRNEKKFLNQTHGRIKHKLDGPQSKIRIQEPWQKSFVLLQASIGQIPIDDYSLRQEMNAMVEYASRMLSALEEYSVRGSRNGQVAMHSLLLRRSLATSLWTQHDGVLNQIINVGQKTAACLNFHGISSFKDVLTSSDKQIERAAQRAPPFAKTLRTAVTTILSGAFKLSASLEYVVGTRSPSNLVCRIERKEASQATVSVAGTPVHYTLLAFTDRAGGCLLHRREIAGTEIIKISTPPLFKKLSVCLIATIVGLDEKMELRGNDVSSPTRQSVIESNMSRPSKQNKRGNTGKPSQQEVVVEYSKAAEQRLKQSTLPANMNSTSKWITPSPKHMSSNIAGPSACETIAQGTNKSVAEPAAQVCHADNHFDEYDSGDPTRFEDKYGNNQLDVSESGDPARSHERFPQKLDNSLTPESTPMSICPQNRAFAPSELNLVTLTSREAPNIHQHHLVHGQNDEPHSWRHDVVNYHTVARHQSPYSKGWVKERKEKENSQRRVFTRKCDNPFTTYMHDPNNIETNFDQLIAGSEDVIPAKERLALDHLYKTHASAGTTPSVFNRATGPRRAARKRGGNSISERDLLAQKSLELQSVTTKASNWGKQHHSNQPDNTSWARHDLPTLQPTTDGKDAHVYATIAYNQPYAYGVNAAEYARHGGPSWCETTENHVFVAPKDGVGSSWIPSPRLTGPTESRNLWTRDSHRAYPKSNGLMNNLEATDSQSIDTFRGEEVAAFWN
ncbi:hypothetical protein MPSEU_000215900 [Mayamaea pseudoterrestris]|nr:hypothetical protein MPSEU_000215900 [Mayamaea pseudoterrestris]